MPATGSSEDQLDEDDWRFLKDVHQHHGRSLDEHKALIERLIREGQKYNTRVLTLSHILLVRFGPKGRSDRLGGEWSQRVKHAEATTSRRASGHLAMIASLWSPELVRHYEWEKESENLLRELRRVAEKYPRFREDFLPRANAVLVRRQEQAMLDNKFHAIQEHARASSPSPLEPIDLKNLLAPLETNFDYEEERQKRWISGRVDFLVGGQKLSERRGAHAGMYLLGHDRYGMLVKREQAALGQADDVSKLTPRDATSAQDEATRAEQADETTDGRLGQDLLLGGDGSRKRKRDTEDSNEESGRLGREESPEYQSDGVENDEDQNEEHERNVDEGEDDQPSDEDEDWSPTGFERRKKRAAKKDSKSGDTSPSEWLTVADKIDNPGEKPSIALEIHRKHQAAVAAYLQKLNSTTRSRKRSSKDLRFLAKAWLNNQTRWARIFAPQEQFNGTEKVGMADCEDTADVIYLTSERFCQEAKAGKTFSRPLLIKEHFTDHEEEDVLTQYASVLRDRYGRDVIDVIRSSTEHEKLPVSSFCNMITSDSTKFQGVNALNLREIAEAQRPRFTQIPRFRFIKSLIAREQGIPGKASKTVPADVSSCTSFDIIGLTGAFSGAHLDVMNGTFVRNLTGLKFWMIVPEAEMENAWDDFVHQSSYWKPKGRERLIVLEKDDVLFMPPGIRVVHAVHTPSTCLMEGGMVWDEFNILKTLETVQWVVEHPTVTNEALPWQLPVVIKTLADWVNDEPERFAKANGMGVESFLDEFRKAIGRFETLGCDCATDDLCRAEHGCVCKKSSRRCTVWCAAHSEMKLDGTDSSCMLQEEEVE